MPFENHHQAKRGAGPNDEISAGDVVLYEGGHGVLEPFLDLQNPGLQGLAWNWLECASQHIQKKLSGNLFRSPHNDGWM